MDQPSSTTRRLIILGSTGSIGTQTLQVVNTINTLHDNGNWPWRFQITGLAAGSNTTLLAQQAQQYAVDSVALNQGSIPASLNTARAYQGPDAAEQLVSNTPCDLVVSAIVGVAGLGATLKAVSQGTPVALANKETLVAAGELIVPLAKQTGAHLLPVDSEHAAIWQCLASASGQNQLVPPCTLGNEISRIVLTASGGPFRTLTRDAVYNATPAQALNHPTWSMGAKVTIDSASLTNKALEIIEAHWLFGLGADRISAIVHPQSIVHSFVEFADGSVIAQLGAPDMRCPIQVALTWPQRASQRASNRLDLATLNNLDFEPPDFDRFPALNLACRVIQCQGTSGAIFNAANEIAVEAFLKETIAFGYIPELTSLVMDQIPATPIKSLDDVLNADRQARACAKDLLACPSVGPRKTTS